MLRPDHIVIYTAEFWQYLRQEIAQTKFAPAVDRRSHVGRVISVSDDGVVRVLWQSQQRPVCHFIDHLERRL